MKKICMLVILLFVFCAVFPALAACTPKNEYDIVYANWNLGTEAQNNLERRMIKEWEQETGYKVKIIENINIAAYEDAIAALVAKNQMPDVFMLTNMTFGLENQYLMDIKSYANSDDEWQYIPEPVEQATHFANGIYAVPFAIHMAGYFVNEDLLNDKNVSVPSVYPSYNTFLSVVESLKLPNSGVIGLNLDYPIIEWYPSSVNNSLGWFTWDGAKYNLDGNEFTDAINKVNYMHSSMLTFDSYKAEDRLTYFNYDSDVDLWNNGGLGLRWGKTFEIPDMLATSLFDDIKFIGTPGGRVPIIGDYLGISKTSKKPEIAFAFAKYMSYGTNGINKRLALDTTGKEFSALPLSTRTEVINSYFNVPRINGLKEAFMQINNGIVECVKVVPGYGRSRWLARMGSSISITIDGVVTDNPQIGQVIDQCWIGTIAIADWKSSLNTIANRAYNTTLDTFKNLYPNT